MTLETPARKGVTNRQIARLLGVTESTGRYQLRHRASGATNGRARQEILAARFREAIDAYLDGTRGKSPANAVGLHACPITEHHYPGSLRSAQRYVRQAFPPPGLRARRRVETPPNAATPQPSRPPTPNLDTVHSFKTLLEDLSTSVRNTHQLPETGVTTDLDIIPTTPHQLHALDLADTTLAGTRAGTRTTT